MIVREIVVLPTKEKVNEWQGFHLQTYTHTIILCIGLWIAEYEKVIFVSLIFSYSSNLKWGILIRSYSAVIVSSSMFYLSLNKMYSKKCVKSTIWIVYI